MTINNNNLSEITTLLNSYNNAKLLIVTKNQSHEDVSALISKGFTLFGENRVQEAKSKFQSLRTNNKIDLHLIGPLQSNKVKIALKIFDVIQTIDRHSLIDEISKQLVKSPDIKTKNFFIQVNIGGEKQKSGVSKKELLDLYNYSIDKKLNIEGLMCIPPNIDDPSDYFREMLEIRDSINKKLKLSMGMSNDYKYALDFKSDIIRVGSLIFS